MPQPDVPSDVLMNDRHDMKCRTWRFHLQAVDDGDADRAKAGTVSKAKANMKRPVSNHGSERLRFICGASGIVLSPVSSRILAPLMPVTDWRKYGSSAALNLSAFGQSDRSRCSLFRLARYSLALTAP